MSNFEVAFLKQRINELEGQVLHIRSTLTNVMANIRMNADEQDYDEIMAICDQWEPVAIDEAGPNEKEEAHD